MSEYPSYLIHYGTPGQKWGVRKYQNEDGTWTEEGLRRRREEQTDLYKSVKKDLKKSYYNRDQKQNINSYKSIVQDSIESSKLKSLSKNKDQFNDELDKISNIVAGKYANKKIKDIDFNETYKDFVKDMIRNSVNETIKFEEEKKKEMKDLSNKINRLKKEDLLSEERYWDQRIKKNEKGEIISRTNDEEIFKKDKRLNNAAIVGLKALDGKYADLSTSNKWWFICEDQTIGKATIADLANQGKTKKQIKQIIDDSKSVYRNTDYEEQDKTGLNFNKGIFQLAEGYNSDKYIDDCIKIAKENTLSDAKQSRIKSLIASGKTQEEVAKMLGVSTSTVNKYK